jgi:uncharacterized glyoxalase superfamily protein PhnB
VGSDDPGAAGRVALWLYTDELDAQVEVLRSAGVPVLTEPHDEVWGERVAAVQDPDGNTVWLAQRLQLSV